MSRRYGWAVLVVAAAAMVGSLPGRTQGLGLVTEPLLADLGIDRVSYAALNFWATIGGSAAALGIGYTIDRHGSRVVVTAVLALLGLVVCLMSRADSYLTLAVGITLTRALGQSALSVVSLAIVGHWFVKRIDTAMAVYSVVISIGFMAAFPLVGFSVQAWGWRAAWLAIGVILAGILAPLAALIVRRNPEAIGLLPDGEGRSLVTAESPDLKVGPTEVGPPSDVNVRPTPDLKVGPTEDAHGRRTAMLDGYTWTAALAMPSFWVFAIGTALYGLVASGIGLFNESILAERGFGPHVYYQTLAVTAMTALIGNFLGGWLSSRVALGRLMGAALFVLAGGVLALPFVSSLTHVMAWASAMGLGGGLVMVLFFSVWGRVFGRRHLGRIQGVAQALTVVASAIGPLLLAWSLAWTGSYAGMFQILAGVIAAVAVAALLITLPDAPPILHHAPQAGDATG